MPVTFNVSTHPANAMNRQGEYTAKEILAAACDDQHRKAEEILQLGFSYGGSESRQFSAKMTGIAYNQHHALVIRPDDVWLTILSQFNFFVNARAELLRANFVAHEGKKELIVTATGTRYDVEFGSLALQMVDLIDKNVVDPTLREWVVPWFTTTTANDTTVSAVLIMATLKAYFSYGLSLDCGIPRVTLEGEKADWVNMLGRLEKLNEYGIETTAWYHLLRPVIARFVAAFDAPSSAENVDFWQRIAHHHAEMSGQDEYSGWITAFTAFNVEGKWIGHRLDLVRNLPSFRAMAELTLGSRQRRCKSPQNSWLLNNSGPRTLGPQIGLTLFSMGLLTTGWTDQKDVPAAYAEVDVKLNDNGVMFDCIMVGGLVGTQVTTSGDLSLSTTGKDDVVYPLSGWWIFTKKENPVTRQEEEAALMAKMMAEFEEKWGSASGPHTESEG
ncbi:hypothetical protein C8J57DRAFT_1499329 [Mycena rebaudengoi]|nr:hypothetical protein C8J57DRAFT_1499329 [Mycena rebaudengoi]